MCSNFALQFLSVLSKKKKDLWDLTDFLMNIFLNFPSSPYSIYGLCIICEHSHQTCSSLLTERNFWYQLQITIESDDNKLILPSLILAEYCFDDYFNYNFDHILLQINNKLSDSDICFGAVRFFEKLVLKMNLSQNIQFSQNLIIVFTSNFSCLPFKCKEQAWSMIYFVAKSIYSDLTPILIERLIQTISIINQSGVELFQAEAYHLCCLLMNIIQPEFVSLLENLIFELKENLTSF